MSNLNTNNIKIYYYINYSNSTHIPLNSLHRERVLREDVSVLLSECRHKIDQRGLRACVARRALGPMRGVKVRGPLDVVESPEHHVPEQGQHLGGYSEPV